MDRIDIRLTLTKPTQAHHRMPGAESSAVMAERVKLARIKASQRWRDESWELNAQAPGNILRTRYCPSIKAMNLLSHAENAGLNPRGSDRVLRLAWTIADLENADEVSAEHLALALSMRGESFE